MNLPSLTIILPVFNEEDTIEKSVNSCKEIARRLTTNFEILLIDDGSQDRTREIIKRLILSEQRIKTTFLPGHMGYGKTLSTGFNNASKEFIFYTDSDLPIDIFKELPEAASLMSEGIDAVIGCRINRNDMFLRKIYSAVYNFMGRIFFGIQVRDINFSCKLLRRRIFDKIKLNSSSVFIDMELLVNLNFYGFKVREFPVTYIARKHGCSNFNSFLYALGIFIEILIFWIRGYLKKDK